MHEFLVRDPRGRLGFEGRAELAHFDSRLLRDNPLGDPHRRELPVYLPPGWKGGPAVLLLAGFTGRGHKYLDPHPWWQSVAQRFEKLVLTGAAPPAALVMPDAFTGLGGSQYVNSSATGPYEDHLIDEIMPACEQAFGINPEAWAVAGKSSGGFGALHLVMARPGRFRAAASVSGDCDFELCFGGEILNCLRGLIPYDMDPAKFLKAFTAKPDLGGDNHGILNVLAMSACYSPNPAAPLGFDLPMELQRGERIDSVWQRWLAFDPLHACERSKDALSRLELLHLECGLRDEFNLQWALRRLVKRLEDLEIPFEHTEHPGGHRGIDERFDVVLPALLR